VPSTWGPNVLAFYRGAEGDVGRNALFDAGRRRLKSRTGPSSADCRMRHHARHWKDANAHAWCRDARNGNQWSMIPSRSKTARSSSSLDETSPVGNRI
jgi:hypothetical protein